MTKLYSHGLETNRKTRLRTYSGEEECRPLVDWLNREGQTPAGLKIQALLTYAHGLSRAAPEVLGDRKLSLERAVAYQLRFWKSLPGPQAAKRAASLHRVLKKVGVPKIWVTVKVGFEGAGRSKRLVLDLASDTPGGQALLSAYHLSKMGVLDHVRKCPRCGQWFFARFAHHRFCQTNCQQEHFRASDAWKEHRKQYMRQYYRDNYMRRQVDNIK